MAASAIGQPLLDTNSISKILANINFFLDCDILFIIIYAQPCLSTREQPVYGVPQLFLSINGRSEMVCGDLHPFTAARGPG